MEGWTQLAILTFLYLEWYRAEQLARRNLTEEQKAWWRRQRTYGLRQALRLATRQGELRYLQARLRPPTGVRRLKEIFRNSIAREYQLM